MEEYERYMHHGRFVSVRKDLKGLHREYCACYQCARFVIPENPEDRDANCPIANQVFKLCVDWGLVLPVWECPIFISKDERNG